MIHSFPHRALGFGLRWQGDVAMHLLPPDESPESPADITVTQVSTAAPRAFIGFVPGARVQPATDGFRCAAGQSATIDATWDGRIQVSPGPEWTGELPTPFFSTVAALLLAVRGAVPLHASAVELDGRAVLICGPGGAGKSTLAASLIAQGARLISDDLSVLHPDPTGGAPTIFPGRRTIRLFSEVAGFLGEKVPWHAPLFHSEGKLAATPPQSSPASPVPVTDVVILTSAATQPSRAHDLSSHFFRPLWMRRVPGYDLRKASLAIAARHLRIHTAPRFEARSSAAFHQGADSVLRMLNAA